MDEATLPCVLALQADASLPFAPRSDMDPEKKDKEKKEEMDKKEEKRTRTRTKLRRKKRRLSPSRLISTG